MMHWKRARQYVPVAVLCAAVTVAAARSRPTAEPLGMFEDHGDVGLPSVIGPGAATYDAATGTYRIAGGGENMWARADHFHFVWKRVSGDVSLAATIRFLADATQPASGTPDPHRKACLIFRQSLDSDSVYVDASLHGDGMTALQWRDTRGGLSHDVQTDVVAPTRLRLEKRGDSVMMFVGGPDAPLRPAGGSTQISLTGEFYVGIGVSAHTTSRIETATFADVEMGLPAPLDAATLVSTLEVISVGSFDRRVVHVSTAPDPLEAPNWYQDSTNTLYFNQGGRLHQIRADLPRAALSPAGSLPGLADVGSLARIGHDHVLSPDGSRWAVTDSSQQVDGQASAHIFVAPVDRGPARRVTSLAPSYVRSWSPDAAMLAFAGSRTGNLDVYTIAAAGGPERRLTTDVALDDGPEFSPDGQHIYFNSNRSGSMQVWRMRADGSVPEQLTADDFTNWFPHVSPNGDWLVFLSAPATAGDRLDNSVVTLRRMNLSTRVIEDVTRFVGGKGSLNVNSWAPTSQHLAFVSYQRVPAF